MYCKSVIWYFDGISTYMSEKIWYFYGEFEVILYLVQEVVRKCGEKMLNFVNDFIVNMRKIKWYVYVFTVPYF